ncbi:LuxR C-terminal-related transcriptional regulator [Kitasatospora sp. NPDC085879]|uniref:response regulator transcription factor n=1 Tax=Kitasatospora sp. NPDC085879 TaxID=3154769 RepID=UPI0034482872
MSAGTAVAERLRVHLNAADGGVRDSVAAALRRAGIDLVPEPDRRPGAVLLAAAGTVDEALEACPPDFCGGGYRLMIVADSFPPEGVRRAVRLGARVLLPAPQATPVRLAAAVRSAGRGDGRMPYEVLARLIGGPPAAPRPAAAPSPLTARQTAVLTLIAEGHGNVAIAAALSCSEHTVKNVVYDLMARLQARNRAHAVARAVRAGLI